MSEMYEGVVFRSEENIARHAFHTLSSERWLRLVLLDCELYGVYLVAGRADAFQQHTVESIARRVSEEVGRAVALIYDNRCGTLIGVLYAGGRRVREFDNGDALWVPYREDGQLNLDGPRYREAELLPHEEYDCVFSAIDAALEALETGRSVSASLIKQAFCYDGALVLAESGNTD